MFPMIVLAQLQDYPRRAMNPTPDQTLLLVASHMEAHRFRVDDVWPGFWYPAPAFALFPFRDGTLIVGLTARHDVASMRVTLPAVPGISPRPAQFLPRRMPSAYELLPFPSFDLEFRVDSMAIVAVSLAQRYGGLQDALSATIYFLLHESFHRYQQQYWVELPDFGLESADSQSNTTLDDVEVPSRDEIARELALLRRAIAAVDRRRAASAYCDYRARQLARYARMPADRGSGEAYVEWIEGVATYVAYAGTSRVLAWPESTFEHLLMLELQPPSSDDPVRLHGEWHLYASGAAKSQLLASYYPAWQSRIAHGATLDELLARDTFACPG